MGFDEMWDQLSPSEGMSAGASPSPSMGSFDAIWNAVDNSNPAPSSDWAGIRNAGVRGVGSLFGLADEFMPQITKEEGVSAPHLFGLFPKKNVPITFQGDFNKLATDTGLLTNEKASSELGKYAADVVENAGAAGPFGPVAMIANGIFSGTGAYGGEKIAGPTGKLIGSVATGFTPVGLSKLGLVKEVGEQLGPIASQFPGIRRLFGDAPIESSVGRALSRSAENLPATENALANLPAQTDSLSKLKTTAELTGDRGIARATDAVENMLPGSPFKAMAEERAATRASDVLSGYDPTKTTYDTSKALEQTISTSAEDVGKIEDIAWKALPGNQEIVANHANDVLASKINEVTLDGSVPLPGSSSGLIKRFATQSSEGPMTLDQVQALRRKALEVGRNAKSDLTEAGQVNRSVSSILANHLDGVIDDNVAAGIFPDDAANTWRAARDITREKMQTFGAPKSGLANEGTRGTEAIGLRGDSLDNTALIKEGLNSPDKLVSQIKAAEMGGQDIRPLYKQALLSELDAVPQSRWADTIGRKRAQWEQVFTPEELGVIEKNLADIESQASFARNSVTSGSATNPRGNVQRILTGEKGLAPLVMATRGAPALAGAYYGAQKGWNSSDTPAGGVAKALLYGAGGALLGKAVSSSATGASDKFDLLLTEALRNPETARRVINSAKPSQFGQALTQAAVDTGKATAIRGASQGLNSVFGNVFTPKALASDPPKTEAPKDKAISQVFSSPKKQNISAVVKSQPPLVQAVIAQESAGNPGAVSNKDAVGLMQILPSTGRDIAEALGVQTYDLKDPETNIKFGTFYLGKLLEQFNGDVELALTAYHSGPGEVQNLLRSSGGSSLSDILPRLGPVGQKYARSVLGRMSQGAQA